MTESKARNSSVESEPTQFNTSSIIIDNQESSRITTKRHSVYSTIFNPSASGQQK